MKSKLEKLMNEVNRRSLLGLNDADQVTAMVEEDKRTKGFTIIPEYDTFRLATDKQKTEWVVDQFGYWSEQMKEWNERLIHKGGYEYMTLMNSPYVGTQA